MLQPVGKKLEQTRRQRSLTVEDVSRATRIRPDRIVDLENDEYGNFPNLAYARSFLLLYAKYLGVDVTEVASSFERYSQFGLDDYEYLTNTPVERPPVVEEQPKHSTLPFVIAGAAVFLAAIVAFFVINARRIGNLEPEASTLAVEESATPTPAPDTALEGAPEAIETPSNVEAAPTVGPVIVASTPSPTPDAPPILDDDNVEVRRAVPLSEAPPERSASENEIILQPLKKTWVKVQQGGSNSPVVFEDFLYPDARPLTLRGEKFHIQADADGNNLKIIRNGEVVQYTAPGIDIE